MNSKVPWKVSNHVKMATKLFFLCPDLSQSVKYPSGETLSLFTSWSNTRCVLGNGLNCLCNEPYMLLLGESIVATRKKKMDMFWKCYLCNGFFFSFFFFLLCHATAAPAVAVAVSLKLESKVFEMLNVITIIYQQLPYIIPILATAISATAQTKCRQATISLVSIDPLHSTLSLTWIV